MGNSVAVKLEKCKQIVRYHYFGGFSLMEGPKNKETYREAKDAIKAFLGEKKLQMVLFLFTGLYTLTLCKEVSGTTHIG